MTLTFEPARGFGVYLHWPYCARICPYCDFNVYAAKDRDTSALEAAILADLDGQRSLTGPRRVDSVFLGGGTPSLMAPSLVERVIARIDTLWGLAPGAEISLEANPEDMDRLPDLAQAGVNRLSLGVQSLDEARLAFLGRTHGADKALKALDLARRHFRSLSCDAIYALPDQGRADWRRELQGFLSLPVDHLSLYELTIEPGAAFSRAVSRGAWTPADEDMAADLYEITQEMTSDAGFDAYEISNHARAPEHRSAHNLIYWRSGDWVGVGPGAHGRLTMGGERQATEAQRRPPDYVAQVSRTGVGFAAPEILTRRAIADERLIMGLRMDEGIACKDVESVAHTPLDRDLIAEFAASGLIRQEPGDRIRLHGGGRLLADYVARRLAG